MRITLESDYALRILDTLARENAVVGASDLAEKTQVSPRFTLKILHKLVSGKLVKSYKGSLGGYKLNKDPGEITLASVIELIDGPIAIARCLGENDCSLNADKSACAYHHIFDAVSFSVKSKLDSITIKDVIEQKVGM